jgi:hypothetical protein
MVTCVDVAIAGPTRRLFSGAGRNAPVQAELANERRACDGHTKLMRANADLCGNNTNSARSPDFQHAGERV